MVFTRYALFIFHYLLQTAADNVPLTVQKCCKIDEALNISPMFCALAPNLSDTNFHFDTATHFGKPNCKDDAVIVEYYSKTTPLTLENDFLIIPAHNSSEASVRISAESFCLDNAFDATSLNSSHVWGAWVCQPVSVCEHMPCVRKCCGPNEHLLEVDEISQCVAHENKKPFVPKFHNSNNRLDDYVEGIDNLPTRTLTSNETIIFSFWSQSPREMSNILQRHYS
jgi:hypothetical protein